MPLVALLPAAYSPYARLRKPISKLVFLPEGESAKDYPRFGVPLPSPRGQLPAGGSRGAAAAR